MLTLDDIRATLHRDPEGWVASTTEAWTQGRTVFGGLTAALALDAMRAELPEPAPLRSLDIFFVAPIPHGPMRIRPRVLRSGRSVTWVEADVLDGEGNLATRVTAIFGAARTTGLALALDAPVLATPPEAGIPFPYLPGVTPACTQHYDFVFAGGAFPMSGGERGDLEGWVRMKAPGSDPLAALPGLVDAWPPAVLSMGSVPFPASTARWSLHLYDEPAPADAWHAYQVTTTRAAEGYATEVATLSHAGRVIAWSEQLVAYFAP